MLIALVFFSVFISLLALYYIVTTLWVSPAAGLKRRLQRLEEFDQKPVGEDAAGQLLRDINPFVQTIFQLPLLRGIKRLLDHSDTHINPFLFLLSVLTISSSVATAVYVWRGNLLVALAAMSVVIYLPFMYLGYCKKRRQTKFAEQLPDALTMIARSMRAGHSLAAAVELIGLELPQPTGGLFKSAYEQQQLGMRITEALGDMAGKIDSTDLHFFVTVIRVNSESGGSLAEVLEKLAGTIRSRLQIRCQVQTYTADGRISGYVLLVLPVVVFAVFNLKNPQYMEVFFTVPACQLSLVVAGVLQIVGYFIIRKINNIQI